MKPGLLRLSSHPRPLRVQASQCDQIDCPCCEVTFRLVEDRDDAEAHQVPMSLEVCVDPETWQETRGPQRSEPMTQLVAEFLRSYPAEKKLAFQAAGREKKAIAGRLSEYRLSPQAMADGQLIPFGQILSERGSISTGGTSVAYRFAHDGREYLVDDLYCSNPNCGCEEVHLEFYEYLPPRQAKGRGIVEGRFLATLSLQGKLKIQECPARFRDRAWTIAEAWLSRFGGDLGKLRWRYDKVKAIARRSVRIDAVDQPEHDLPVTMPMPITADPGRNDPCPCGSGKKYKKCCGR